VQFAHPALMILGADISVGETALLFALIALAVASAAVGVRLTSVPALSRRIVPFSGALLVIIALLWVLPELAEQFGWAGGVAWLAGGVAVLFVVDKFVHPVCPACSPSHDHDHCATRLHGFAGPLITAASVHCMLDGWGIVSSHRDAMGALGLAVLLGIALHKIPEGLALGVILRASVRNRWAALGWCAFAQAFMLAGGWVVSVATFYFSTKVIMALLALAGGSFLYLGAHALHGEVRRLIRAAS
jgi:zinc transporter ZupT